MPSSCQVTVAGLPAGKVVVATGAVTKTLAKAEAEIARTTKVDENIVYELLRSECGEENVVVC